MIINTAAKEVFKIIKLIRLSTFCYQHVYSLPNYYATIILKLIIKLFQTIIIRINSKCETHI